MSTFEQLSKRTRPPARTILLEPWVWADEWQGHPTETVCVGLRRMSDGDKSKARAEAEKLAFEMHPNAGPNWTDAFNDCLIRQVAALAICSPNDVNQPSEVMPYAEEQVRFAITSRGASWIYEEFTTFETETAPLNPEASDEELDELVSRIDARNDSGLVLTAENKRLLRRVLDELREQDALDQTD